jgi:hypothetical protein
MFCRLPEKLLSANGNTALELNMSQEPAEIKTTTIAETNNYMAWRAEEPDGETTYHLELNNVTLHFFEEEWGEILNLMRMVVKKQ